MARRRGTRPVLQILVAAAMALCAAPASAAPDEIRVMTDELTDRGEFSLELHAASVRGRSGAATRHVGQGLAELSYGISDTLEVALQLPVSGEPGWHANGTNVELHYIAPHDHEAGAYWGTRVELGRVRAPLEAQRATAVELRPIVGYRAGPWHAALNVAMRSELSGANHAVAVEPAFKLAREVAARTQVGVEYYEQAAQRGDGVQGSVPRRKLALLVMDTRVLGLGLSVGVGRGMGGGADGAVVKMIVGREI